METVKPTKENENNPPKMTLKGYYQKLPLRNAPRHEFIIDIMKRCHVTEQTVRNWILYGIKPQQRIHIDILCEITGIKEEDLW